MHIIHKQAIVATALNLLDGIGVNYVVEFDGKTIWPGASHDYAVADAIAEAEGKSFEAGKEAGIERGRKLAVEEGVAKIGRASAIDPARDAYGKRIVAEAEKMAAGDKLELSLDSSMFKSHVAHAAFVRGRLEKVAGRYYSVRYHEQIVGKKDIVQVICRA